MALSDSLKTIVEAKMNNLLSQLSTIQPTYKGNEDRYWQGLSCVATIPADGGTVATDPTVKPTDQTENWSNVNGVNNGVTLDVSLPVSLQVDVYDGPNGQGYVVIGQVEEAGRIYQKSVNVGAETFREHDWLDVTEVLI